MKCGKSDAACSRRAFLSGCVAVSTVGCTSAPTARKGELDPYSIGVFSDMHTGMPRSMQQYRTGREYLWMPEAAKKLVSEILALPNPPANIIDLGDISLAFGETGDYRVAAEVMKPLTDAGIKVTHAMGNHDIRAEFLKFFPGYDKTTKVQGRFVSVVETPHVDFILLDSLKEPDERGSYRACCGHALGAEQLEWLQATLSSATKPVFVCAHHNARELGLARICPTAACVQGYLHGHHHHWLTNYLDTGYRNTPRSIRMMGLPSFGLDRDIGWGLIRTDSAKAVLECHSSDYYFPDKYPENERPASWAAFANDWNGRRITFAFA